MDAEDRCGQESQFFDRVFQAHDLTLAYPVGEHGRGEAKTGVGVGDVGAGVGLAEQDVRVVKDFFYRLVIALGRGIFESRFQIFARAKSKNASIGRL